MQTHFELFDDALRFYQILRHKGHIRAKRTHESHKRQPKTAAAARDVDMLRALSVLPTPDVLTLPSRCSGLTGGEHISLFLLMNTRMLVGRLTPQVVACSNTGCRVEPQVPGALSLGCRRCRDELGETRGAQLGKW
jgi:hypothetical protein